MVKVHVDKRKTAGGNKEMDGKKKTGRFSSETRQRQHERNPVQMSPLNNRRQPPSTLRGAERSH